MSLANNLLETLVSSMSLEDIEALLARKKEMLQPVAKKPPQQSKEARIIEEYKRKLLDSGYFQKID